MAYNLNTYPLFVHFVRLLHLLPLFRDQLEVLLENPDRQKEEICFKDFPQTMKYISRGKKCRS